MINMFKRALLALSLLLPAPALAGVPCVMPFTLTNGTIADATQVMANYNALVTCLGSAAAAGVNNDITALLALTTPLTPGSGGASTFFQASASTGAANAQVVASTTPNSFSLVAGYQVLFNPGFTNTGAATLNVNSTGAKNVFRRTPGGPQALTGGEIVVSQPLLVIYDGTQFEILSNSAEFGGFGALTNIASAGTTDLGTAATHNVNVTGTNTITSFGSSANTTYPFYRVTFNSALTLTHNATSLIMPGTANFTTAANDTLFALYLGSGNWQVVGYQRADGFSVVPSVLNIQNFTAGGTWTRTGGVGSVYVLVCGSGGGGGGASREAAGIGGAGGGGGGGGACQEATFKAADAGASQTVTIATGGGGGGGSSTNGSSGVNGTAGSASSFGGLLVAAGGGGGGGGVGGGGTGGAGGGGGGGNVAGTSAAAGVAGVSPFGLAQTACGGLSNSSQILGCPWGGGGGGKGGTIIAGGAAGMAPFGGPGGAGGGASTVANAGNIGGVGGQSRGCPTGPAGGAAGSTGGSTAASFNYLQGCGGGGGGSGNGAVAAGGNGGAGTNSGGGGGGGQGVAANGGSGGNGGNGFALVISW